MVLRLSIDRLSMRFGERVVWEYFEGWQTDGRGWAIRLQSEYRVAISLHHATQPNR